jgi:hypothetical protein
MRTTLQIMAYLSLLCFLSLSLGCAVRLKPVVHTVPYQSDVVCAVESTDCPWARLEEQAKFSAQINCLLSGATVLNTGASDQDVEDTPSILVPTPPKYGYEFIVASGDGRQCAMQESACVVASRNDNEVTWAGCGHEPLEEALRGGEDSEHADQLTKSVVVTGSLANSTNTFQPRDGLGGPDQYYTFTLTEQTIVETAVGVNSSDWSPTKGHRTPWQPGLFLLTSDGQKIRDGHTWRAGVTYLIPMELDPGTYYLVVDSAQREFARGDGRYRLYLGLNKNHMGSIHSQ